MTKLLGLSGSLRKDSFNTKLMYLAIEAFGEADVTIGNMRMPLYDGDLETEEGIVSEAELLAEQITDADAVIMASPEYNQGIPGVLKNALDWVSRVDGSPWAGKPVAFVHATAGRTGGARANYALRLAMAPFNIDLVSGPEVLVAGAFKEFDDAGKIANEHYQKAIAGAMAALRAKTG